MLARYECFFDVIKPLTHALHIRILLSFRSYIHNILFITNDYKLTVGAAGMAVASLVIAAHSSATLWGKKGEFLRQSILNMLRQERREATVRWYTYHRLLQTRIPSLPDHHRHIGLVMVDGQLHFNHAD